VAEAVPGKSQEPSMIPSKTTFQMLLSRRSRISSSRETKTENPVFIEFSIYS